MATRQKAPAYRSQRSDSLRGRPTTKPAVYLCKISKAVREHFASATDLPAFLAGAGTLTPAEWQTIVHQALVLIEQNYAHLPLKRAMHSIDPRPATEVVGTGNHFGQ